MIILFGCYNITGNSQGIYVENQDGIVQTNKLFELSLKTYQNREELLKDVRSIAFSQRYATTIKRSKPNHYVIIGCDR